MSSSSRRRSAPDPEFLRVAFLHPDLGLGGAERLVVDAAAELAARGHTVDVFTSHFDSSRCFDECRSGAFRVIVAGSWFPRSLLGGRFVALCALVRCCFAAAALAWHARRGAARGGHSSVGAYDAVVVDQVAGVVPVLRFLLWLFALILPAPAPPLAVVARGGGGGSGGARRGGGRSAPNTNRHPHPSSHTPILFYCHFPDLLLSGGRRSFVKRIYRLPLDALEQAATSAADACLVNSRFTAGVFAETFPQLAKRGISPGVLYPAAAVPSVQELMEAAGAWPGEVALTPAQRAVVREAAEAAGVGVGGGGGSGGNNPSGGLRSALLQRSRALNVRAHRHLHHHEANGAAAAGNGKKGENDAENDDLAAFLRGGPALLSVNRFERKKGLALGLEALRRVLDDLQEEREAQQAARERRRRQQQGRGGLEKDDDDGAGDAGNTSSSLLPPPGDPRLVFAGGHDPRLPENVEHLRELMAQAHALGLWKHVRWVPSFSDRQRALLLAACRAVLYTPLNEHFGIVPLEAMAAARPVVCLASGGPLESVVDGETGFLCDPPDDPASVAAAWRAALQGGGTVAAAMGLAARRHVEARFSREAFGDALERALRGMVEGCCGGA